jgi:hypothetical protein
MPLDKPIVIDRVSIDKGDGRARLLLIVLPEEMTDGWVPRLIEKVNNYAAFACEGQLQKSFNLEKAKIVISYPGTSVPEQLRALTSDFNNILSVEHDLPVIAVAARPRAHA